MPPKTRAEKLKQAEELRELNIQLLETAFKGGDGKNIVALLQAGADVNARDEYQDTPLHKAACACGDKCINALLQASPRPDVNARNRNQETPLHRAVSFKDFDAVQALLAAGADVRARDWNQSTPLFLATNTPQSREVYFVLATNTLQSREVCLPDFIFADTVAALLQGGAGIGSALEEWSRRTQMMLDQARATRSPLIGAELPPGTNTAGLITTVTGFRAAHQTEPYPLEALQNYLRATEAVLDRLNPAPPAAAAAAADGGAAAAAAAAAGGGGGGGDDPRHELREFECLLTSLITEDFLLKAPTLYTVSSQSDNVSTLYTARFFSRENPAKPPIPNVLLDRIAPYLDADTRAIFLEACKQGVRAGAEAAKAQKAAADGGAPAAAAADALSDAEAASMGACFGQ